MIIHKFLDIPIGDGDDSYFVFESSSPSIKLKGAENETK